jgi:hypothetical protein
MEDAEALLEAAGGSVDACLTALVYLELEQDVGASARGNGSGVSGQHSKAQGIFRTAAELIAPVQAVTESGYAQQAHANAVAQQQQQVRQEWLQSKSARASTSGSVLATDPLLSPPASPPFTTASLVAAASVKHVARPAGSGGAPIARARVKPPAAILNAAATTVRMSAPAAGVSGASHRHFSLVDDATPSASSTPSPVLLSPSTRQLADEVAALAAGAAVASQQQKNDNDDGGDDALPPGLMPMASTTRANSSYPDVRPVRLRGDAQQADNAASSQP